VLGARLAFHGGTDTEGDGRDVMAGVPCDVAAIRAFSDSRSRSRGVKVAQIAAVRVALQEVASAGQVLPAWDAGRGGRRRPRGEKQRRAAPGGWKGEKVREMTGGVHPSVSRRG
jgi:hypothetical protein